MESDAHFLGVEAPEDDPVGAAFARRPDEAAADNSGAALATISSALTFWKGFDLESARSQLDRNGLAIAESQEASLRNRRLLAEATRDFKRAPVEERPAAFGPLLKAYQEEVDALTKRAKQAESAFLGMYEQLYEAPDPAPVLATAAAWTSRAAESEAAASKLAAELAEYRAESAGLKNQQVTIRRLEERCRVLESQMEDKVKEGVAARERAYEAEAAAAAAALAARESGLAEQLAAARSSLGAMQKLQDASQSALLALRSQSDEEQAAASAQAELLSAEMERAEARLAALEREKDALAAKLTAADGEAGAGGRGGEGTGRDANGLRGSGGDAAAAAAAAELIARTASLEAELAARDRQVRALHRELADVEAAANTQRATALAAAGIAREQLAAAEARVERLSRELSARPTAAQVRTLRSRVQALQAVGYNALEEDGGEQEDEEEGEEGEGEWGEGGDGGEASRERRSRRAAARAAAGSDAGPSSAAAASAGRRLEALLLDKNRRVEHELTQARLALSERADELAAARAQAESLAATAAAQRALITQLEDDLAQTGTGTGTAGTHRASIAAGGESRAAAGGKLTGADGLDAWGELLSPGSKTADGTSGRGLSDGEPALGDADDRSVVAVVASQRDRFRRRLTEIEEELRLAKEALARATRERDAARADAVALVEKLRYVSSYGARGAGGARAAAALDLEAAAANPAGGGPGGGTGAARKAYEAGIDPFAEFHRAELRGREQALRLHDRITLRSGRAILGNRYLRAFVFFYSIVLHALVFGVLWRISHYHQDAFHDCLDVSGTGLEGSRLASRLGSTAADAGGLFRTYDTDSDGRLSEKEFKAAMAVAKAGGKALLRVLTGSL